MKRYYPRTKQVIFILGIIIISVITGFFGSFFTGITQRDYYVDSNNNDIITILESGYKTPIVSYIPSNYVDVLKHINGVEAISPEIHALVMIDQQPITLHGITKSFFELNSSTDISGAPLSYIVTSNRSNIFIAGATVAKILGLTVGKIYNIYSSNTNSFSSFYLAGINKFDSFYDEEIFSNIDAARFFRSTTTIVTYSMIRLKLNTNVITKDEINNYLDGNFTLQLNFASHYYDPSAIQFKTVRIILSNGVPLTSNITNQIGECTFTIPVGVYDIWFYSDAGPIKYSLLFLNNSAQTFFIDSFGSNSPPTTGSDLTLIPYYNSSAVPLTALQITDTTGNVHYFNGSSQYVFNKLPSGTYNIKATYDQLTINKTIDLLSNITVALNFTNKLTLIVKDGFNNTVPMYSCSFLNYRTGFNSSYSTCPSNLSLENSIYNITIHSPGMGSRSLIYEVNETASKNLTVYMGNNTQLFEIKTDSNTAYAGLKVYYRPTSQKSFVYLNQTDSSGQITFPYSFGQSYYLLFSNGTFNSSVSFTPDFIQQHLSYVLFDRFTFKANFVDGNKNYSPISNLPVNITTIDGTISQISTQNDGQIAFNSSYEFVGQFDVDYEGNIKSFKINTLQNKNYNISLGYLDLDLSIDTSAKILIPNLKINIFSSNYNQTVTNSNGTLSILLPTETNYNSTNENFIYPSNINISTFPNNFLVNYYYMVNMSYNDTSKIVFVPRYYEYAKIEISALLPYSFLFSIRFADAVYNTLPNVQVTFVGKNFVYNTITGPSGLISNVMNAGQYEMNIKFDGYYFSYKISVFNDSFSLFLLPFVWSKLNLVYYRSNLSALSGQQYLDEFYSTSINYFIEIFTILIIIFNVILILLFASVVKLTSESINDEIFVLNILGASKLEMVINLIYNFQFQSILSSALGLGVGMFITQFLNPFYNIHLLGFVFYSQFNIFYFFLFLFTINAIIFIVIINNFRKINVVYPIRLLRKN